MGAWYLQKLGEGPSGADANQKVGTLALQGPPGELAGVLDAVTQLVVIADQKEERLKERVAKARARLAELEAAYTIEKRAVETAQSILFGILRPYFQKRDKLDLVVRYRRKFLEALLTGGEEEAERVVRESETAAQQTDAEYEQTASNLADRKILSGEEEEELKRLWRKLVGLFHPDRFAMEPDKQ
jgi:DNA polymerase-3 subunit epsilon